jgi:hypothetical protein
MIAFLCCVGAVFIYLRFVAKEIDRRERYLQQRLEDKIKEWEEEQNRGTGGEQADSESDGDSPVVVATEATVPGESPQSQAA